MTPIEADDLEVEEIQLPPGDIMAEMIAEEEAAVAPAPSAAKAVSAVPPDVAALTFVGGRAREISIDLTYPFEQAGSVIGGVSVRRLTAYEVSDFVRAHVKPDGTYDRFALYAVMTGLPAATLRGLDQDDSFEVTRACSDFLPRLLAGDA